MQSGTLKNQLSTSCLWHFRSDSRYTAYHGAYRFSACTPFDIGSDPFLTIKSFLVNVFYTSFSGSRTIFNIHIALKLNRYLALVFYLTKSIGMNYW